MANLVPLAIADVELQLSTAISVGSTSFSLSSATDDDGEALPAGKYCFTVNNGKSNKQYLMGQLNGTNVTSVVTVSRQGVESAGAEYAARVGDTVIITDFATIQRVADILRGQLALDGSNPIIYDAEPTLADRKELATVGYVLDAAFGGSLAFDNMTVAGNGGESIVAGNLVYFKTSDQEWYKTDADTAATVEGVQLGIALGTGSDGVSITGGVQIAGTYTTSGLTPGALYYASNTAGAISASAGTTSRVVGIALSSTKLLIIPRNPQDIKDAQKDAMAGGATFGAPSSTNKFITQDYNSSATGLPVIRTYTASTTWTKPSGLKYVVVEAQAPGGDGAAISSLADSGAAGGGSGGYAKKLLAASVLGSTETVTVGATTSFTVNGGSTISCTSGTTPSANSEAPGVGGTASNGDLNIAGNSGLQGRVSSAGTELSGMGANSVLGIGGGSKGSSGVGVAATGYGAGGGGALNTGSANSFAGGTGGPGVVIVTEYYS